LRWWIERNWIIRDDRQKLWIKAFGTESSDLIWRLIASVGQIPLWKSVFDSECPQLFPN
jgi:hypothetical protein